MDINRADYEMLLRVPGLGVKSAKMILTARRYSRLGTSHLKQIGVVLKKAQYFITCNELPTRTVNEIKTRKCKADSDTKKSNPCRRWSTDHPLRLLIELVRLHGT